MLKKCSIRIGLLSIAFSVMLLFVSPGTRAETQDRPKTTPVSELHLESAGHPGSRIYSVHQKDLASNPLRGFLIPLKEGLTAFVDCAPPPHQEGLTPEDAGTNYRAVIGLHFAVR
jgi:hypothetical protein